MCQPTQPEVHKMRVFDTYKNDKEDVPIHRFITAAHKSASFRRSPREPLVPATARGGDRSLRATPSPDPRRISRRSHPTRHR